MEAIKIHIGSTADTAGFDKITDAEKRATDAADKFFDAIKQGVGIDIGGKIVNSIAAIPQLFQDAISRGVEFNMQMGDAEIGIANVLAKFMDLDKIAAKREAAKAMAQIVELEPKTAGGLSDLVQGFLATVASGQSAGMTVRQNIDLVGRFANALANANIEASQLPQELRAIFTGNITPDAALAKVLQIDNKDIANAKEAGNLYDFLVGRIGQLGEAGDSAGVRLSTFQSTIDKALGKLAKPISTAFLDGIKDLTNELSGADTKDLEKLGAQIAELVKQGVSFTRWAAENNGTLLAMAKAVGYVVAAYAAFRIASIVAGLGLKARAILANKAALDAETASLAANSAGQRANAASRVTAGSAVAGTGAALASPTGTVLAGASAAYGAYQLGHGIADTYAGFTQGGKSSKGDIEESMRMRNRNMAELADFVESVKNVKTEGGRDELKTQLAELIQKLVSEQKDAGLTESGRTAQNQALADYAQALSQLLQVLSSKSGLASADDVKKQATAKDEDSKKKDQAKLDAEAVANAERRRQDAARDRIAREGIDSAREMAKGGDADGAGKALTDLRSRYEEWLNQAKAQQPGKSGEDLKRNLELQEQLRGYLDDIKKAFTEFPELVEKAGEEARKKEADELQDQIELIEAQGRLRLEQAGEDGARRKQIEDEIAQKRLELENRIGDLQDESGLKREARETAYAADRLARENQLAKDRQDKSPTGQTKPGELFAGTNRRRGWATSDTAEQGIDLMRRSEPLTNWSDQLKQKGGFPAGPAVVPPSSIPPAAATTPAPGKQPGDDKQGSDPAKAIANESQNLVKALKPIADAISKGLKGVGEDVVSSYQSLKKDVDELKQKVNELGNE